MKENRMKDALENIARRGVPEDVNLWPRIAVEFDERKSLMNTLRARPIVTIIVILLVMLILTTVAYAIGRLTGYIPGVGLVDRSGLLRVLAEPVSVTREGVTVTIKNVVIASDKTSVQYYVDGVPRSAYPEGEAVTGCIGSPFLQLPNGTKMNVSGNMPSIPADVNEAVFVLPCIFNTLPGTVPRNWELPLRFVPTPPELTVIPVTIMPVSSPAATVNGVSANPLRLTNALDVGDSFVLMGEFDPELLGEKQDNSWWWVKSTNIMDANGTLLPNMASSDFEFPTPTTPTAETWIHQVKKNFVPPLTITYETEHIIPVGLEEQTEFEFDAGQNPQAGNEWVVNKDFKMGGYNIRLISISSSPNGYSFQFEADSGASANGIGVEIVGYIPNCGGGGGGADQFPEKFSRDVCFAEIPGSSLEFPKGILKVIIHFQALQREDKTFQLVWSPAEPYVTPTPKPGVCLGFDKWNQLKGQEATLPAGLGGKLLTTVDDGKLWPAVHIRSFDGSSSTKMGNATWPSLSTDGTKLAYSVDDGIHIHNLLNGENHAIGIDGYKIMWSPDSTRILFTNTHELYVANVDGSGIQKINTPVTQVISPTGWTDNQTIWYTVMGGDGFTLTSYNLQSGEATTSFKIHNKAGYGAISPDGQWIVFADHAEDGTINWGIYMARLDGSERQLVVDPQIATAFASYWSPDGQWLLVNTRDLEDNNIPILVNPFTCEVLALKHIEGTVEGWSP